MIEVAIAVAVIGAIGTAALLFTPHEPLSAKNLRPQLTSVCVSVTTWLIAGTISAHFEVAPQPWFPHEVFVWSSFIDPDASRTIRMSGGSFNEDFGKVAQPTWPATPPEPDVLPPKLPMPVTPALPGCCRWSRRCPTGVSRGRTHSQPQPGPHTTPLLAR